MPDTTITQHADIKVLMPILQEALKGSDHALHLNMIGPIYIGTKDNGQTQIEGPRQSEAPQRVEVSTDDMFAGGLNLDAFIQEAERRYFRIVASSCHFDREQIQAALDISEARMYYLGRKHSVKFSTTKRTGQLLILQPEV